MRVNELDAPQLAWSVDLRTRSAEEIDREVQALINELHALVSECFPSAGGYDACWYRLSGPIEGARVRITRGRFRGLLSVQRFERGAAPAGSERRRGLRTVASVEIVPTSGELAERAMIRRPIRRWRIASGTLGTVALSAMALGMTGVLGAWVHALLVLPALLAWRVCSVMTLAAARSPAALAGRCRHERPGDTVLQDTLGRWRRLLEQVQVQRERWDDRTGLPPFRATHRASLTATG